MKLFIKQSVPKSFKFGKKFQINFLSSKFISLNRNVPEINATSKKNQVSINKANLQVISFYLGAKFILLNRQVFNHTQDFQDNVL